MSKVYKLLVCIFPISIFLFVFVYVFEDSSTYSEVPEPLEIFSSMRESEEESPKMNISYPAILKFPDKNTYPSYTSLLDIGIFWLH